MHRGGALVSDYGFDDNGNRTTHRIGPASPLRGQSWPCLGAMPAGGDVTVSGSYDAQDRMSAYGTCSYEYTRNGELTRRVDSATSSTTEYDYDEFGNLRRVVLPDTRVITYHIDGLNRRVGKSINGVRQWGLLYANQLEPVAELDAAGNVVASFIYADRPHVPSLMLKGGQTYRILADHLGSVRLVVNIATGAIVQRMTYDEYGNVVEDTNPGFQPFGYAGGIYDRDTGLVRFGARDYDAVAGRWTAKDPIGFGGGQANLYEYVSSNPLSFYDPSGLELTGEQIANIIFNETRSLTGPGIDRARADLAHAIMNGDEKLGNRRPKTAPDTVNVFPGEQDIYQECRVAVLEARLERLFSTDPTNGAMHFNMRKNNSFSPFYGYQVQTQTGPFTNSYPSPDVPAEGIYVNTYGR